MPRPALNPADYGINLSRADFVDRLVVEFLQQYQGRTTIDELVLRPREALKFCDTVRRNNGWGEQLGDDVILRALMNQRKASGRKASKPPQFILDDQLNFFDRRKADGQ